MLDSRFLICCDSVEPLQPVVAVTDLVLILFVLLSFVLQCLFFLFFLLFRSLEYHVGRLKERLAIDAVVKRVFYHVGAVLVGHVLTNRFVLGRYFDELVFRP